MNHPAELALHQYLQNAVEGKSHISDETIDRIASDIKDALKRQFGGNKREFRMRMSNVGKASCQLWFEKNHPEKALPFPTTFVMNMMIGDIVEAIFKGLFREANIEFKDSDSVDLELSDGTTVSGTYDLILDGKIDDVKSASNWSYKNKFNDFSSLKESDPFGYIAQLAGYAKAAGVEAGGWWVINKATGEFKYVAAEGIDIDQEIAHIQHTIQKLESNEFERCFEAEDEMFRGKPTGNKILSNACSFCSYRYSCWPTLQELPSIPSSAKEPKIINYVHIKEESMKNDY